MCSTGKMTSRASRKLMIIAAGAAAAALCGCGGGGGGGTAPAPANLMSAPGAAAINSYFQASHSSTLKASAGGNSLSLQVTYTPNSGTTMFEGQTVDSASNLINLYQNGSLVGSNNGQTDYFKVSPYADVGSIAANGTQYAVVTSFTTMPATINVGQSGSVESETIYHDSTKAATDATATTTYSVNADTPSTLQYCATIVLTANSGNPDGLVSGTEVDCYRVDASGNATLYSVTISVNGANVTFR